MPIDVKKAVLTATEYLAEVMRIRPELIVLEEVEMDDRDGSWNVTFSWPTPETKDLTHIVHPRTYKTVKVDADTGQLQAITIKRL